jgi:hypothetical protein
MQVVCLSSGFLIKFCMRFLSVLCVRYASPISSSFSTVQIMFGRGYEL